MSIMIVIIRVGFIIGGDGGGRWVLGDSITFQSNKFLINGVKLSIRIAHVPPKKMYLISANAYVKYAHTL